MKLSREADSYYRLVLGQRLGDIERWFLPEMKRMQSLTPPGGKRNQRIADVIIERWERLVDARVECLLEAYKLHNEIIERTDIERFFSNLMSGITSVQASFGHYAEVSGVSRYLSNKLEPINRAARNKLYIALRRAERTGQQKGERIMYSPRYTRENDFLNDLDRRAIDIKVEPEPGVPGRQHNARALRIDTEKFLLSKAASIECGHQFQYRGGGNDWWEVIDREEEWSGANEMIGHLVTVERVGKDRKRTARKNEPGVVIGGSFIGALQVGGSHNVQVVSVNQTFDESFNKLRKAIEGSEEITKWQKEDAVDALCKLPALAKEERTDGAIKRAKEKLEVVKSAISIGKDLAVIAMPYLEALAKHWS